jgi:tetratricopeptide (TPR) repeat protein
LFTGMMARLRDRPASFGAHRLRDLTSAIEQLALPAADPRHGWVLQGRAALELARGDLDAAERAGTTLWDQAQLHGWEKGSSRGLRVQAAVARRRLDLGQAVGLASRALEAARSTGDEAAAFRELAAAERLRGRMKAASTYVKEGRSRAGERPALEGWLWVEVARIGLSVGRHKDAVRALSRARAAFAKAGDVAGYCTISEGHGWAALEEGDVRVADQRLASAQQAWIDIGQRRAAARTLLRRGLVAAQAGRYDRAMEQLRDVAGAVGAVGDRRLEIVSRLGIAAVSVAAGSDRGAAATVGLLLRDVEEAKLVDPDVARLLVLASGRAPELMEPARSQLRRLGRRGEADALGT